MRGTWEVNMWAVKQINNNGNFASGDITKGEEILFMVHHGIKIKKNHTHSLFCSTRTASGIGNTSRVSALLIFRVCHWTEYLNRCFYVIFNVTPFQFQRRFDKTSTKVRDYMRNYTSLFCGDICQQGWRCDVDIWNNGSAGWVSVMSIRVHPVTLPTWLGCGTSRSVQSSSVWVSTVFNDVISICAVKFDRHLWYIQCQRDYLTESPMVLFFARDQFWLSGIVNVCVFVCVCVCVCVRLGVCVCPSVCACVSIPSLSARPLVTHSM